MILRSSSGARCRFRLMDNQRAKTYRRLNDIPASWGTAVSVQAMVFGNMGEDCATGVAFTRNPATGENEFYGEYLLNAQSSPPQPVKSMVRIQSSSRSRRLCQRSTRSSWTCGRSLSNISRTCRTLSSPSKGASCTCCRRGLANAPRKLHSRSPWTWQMGVSSVTLRPSWA
mmetsp:Transcript_116685/g.375560  ORF Transcript_116685/g.375560 Transcript_116685/m.375560 type:complete len:171 (+) Transcript_116685:179-691(+)